MPRFADIPKPPVDILTPDAVKTDVGALIAERRALNGAVARLPPAPSDTEDFAARAGGPLLANGLTPPPPDQAERTNDFAKVTRASVQPPQDPSATDAPSPVSQPQQRHGDPPHR
jgi:hypothetical protein